MTASRIVQVVGTFLFSILMYSSFAVADETITITDSDGGDDLSPPGFAALYAEVKATLRTSDCTYNTWSHTKGSSFATPNPPYTVDWESHNSGDNTRDHGHTRTWLEKNGAPYLHEALAIMTAQPTSSPPCLT